MKPSQFIKYPYDSVLRNSEIETVACNIMVILARLGDEFRLLSWEEYKQERKKDGNFTMSEKHYFIRVVGFCVSAESAKAFSPSWSGVQQKRAVDLSISSSCPHGYTKKFDCPDCVPSRRLYDITD